MTAISRPKVKLYFTAAGVNPSAVAATDSITGEITSWSKSGGEDDVESVPAFGGFIDKEKPISQITIDLEITPSIETATSDRWDAMIYGTTNSVYTYNSAAANKAVFIQAQDTALGTKSWAFNNCNAMKLDVEDKADDVATYKLSFKFSPQTAAGISNFMTKGTAVTSLPAWTTLTSA
jgi:hypothetical protein